MKEIMSSSLKMLELDLKFLCKFGGSDRGRGGREVTRGSVDRLLVRLSWLVVLLLVVLMERAVV